VPCGYKHFHNFFFLLPSFHNPWIIVIVINYIDNKRKSIAIHFFGVIISTVGGQGGFVFSCCHKYNRWWDLFAFSFTVQWWRGEEQQFFDKGLDFDILELVCLLYKHLVLVAIITIREGLGSFFLAAISIVGGGIYLCFLSQCSDEKEQ